MNELDFHDLGDLPNLYKVILVLLASGLLIVIFYNCVLSDQLKYLDQVEAEEITLKDKFRSKAKVASSLGPYREQVVEIKSSFKHFLNILPNKKELASLLDDISFIGSHNGLQFKSINWGVKKRGELSEEVPIHIKVIGTYAQLGQFSADIAALPRIVILEKLQLKPSNNGNLLMLDVVAKTYRYQEHK